ncbi:MAG: FAD-binding oxidoreductase, partial [Paracoccaceae bacterium]|nr:FAD-binding oxidoreductase [Paracoccaceae bacterium]
IEVAARIAEGRLIARGNGRAYGDAALSATNTVDMRRFNRMIAFNANSGQLVVEAGVLLSEVIATFLPRGWFPAVTPGTKFVTIGGMVAADVHGKNHHRDGSFGAFVDWIELMGADGVVRRCAPDVEPDLFHWTLGGMGLTGVILRVAFRLRPVETAYIRQTTIAAANLDDAMDVFEANQGATYSVAWIDCLSKGTALGRSLVMLGEHAVPADLGYPRRNTPYLVTAKRKLAVPMDAPAFALNTLAVRAFNAVYYRQGLKKAGTEVVDWDGYFYPLDGIEKWNRIYGRRGFMQFQCALPLANSAMGMRALLEAISASGQGSFLAVLKRFGAQSGHFSFPMEGYTLALDFPVNAKTLALMAELDRLTVQNGGRFYLAKDSRMTPYTLRQADPERVAAFVKMRMETKAGAAFSSAQSERLGL